MFDIFKAVISGNLTEDPTLRKSKEGREYVTFSVAANIESELTNYFTVYCFEKRQMDFATAYLQKGSGIVVIGSVQQRKSQSSSNTYLRIVPSDICLKGSAKSAPSANDNGELKYDEEYL